MLETLHRPTEAERRPEAFAPRPTHRAALARAPARRRFGHVAGFLMLVAVPTLLFGAWQYLAAADQYAVEIRFAVRPADPARGALPGGMLAGLAAGNTDAYAVVQHLQSREAILGVARHADVRAILGRDHADWLARLDPSAPLETALPGWRRQVRPYFDRASGIVTVEIRAFSPADAQLLAQGVEATAEALVNAMSARSRGELMAAAARDVSAAEARFAAARAEVQAFRERRQTMDPRRSAAAYSEHLVRLQSELIAQTAQLATLRGVMSEAATPVAQLRAAMRGTQDQIAAVQARLTEPPPAGSAQGAPLSETIGGYEAMETEAIFAQRAYEAAMTALERARAEAQRQQVYLAPVVRPVLPESAIYPARITNTLTVLAAALLAWFVGLVALRALKEHLA